MFSRLLVPVDGTPEALEAVDAAIAIARICKASVHLLHVVPSFPAVTYLAERVGATRELYEQEAGARALAWLSQAREHVLGAGVACEGNYTFAARIPILDATLWVYSKDTAESTTMPPLPPGSCDDTVGGEITGQAHRAGVAIDAGTDFIGDWTDPWPDLFHELDTLAAKAGMPNDAILQSATLISARAAGQQRDMGSIEPGKLANMVVLTRNPLVDLRNLRSVLMSVKRGRVYARSAFVPLTRDDITDR